MEWFSGEVVKAIAECRKDSSLFIVFVHDDSQASKATEGVWSTPEVQEVLSVNKYVALKISKDSVQYHQFSQLFPVFIFPSVFCIGLTGQSLVVMNGGQSSSQLRDKIAEAFEKLRQELSGAPPTAPPTAPPSTQSPSTTVRNGPLTPPLPTPTPPTTSHPSTTSTDSEGPPEPASMAPDGGTSEPPAAAASGRSKEETLQHYQEQIKQRRQARAEEEAQRKKHQEIDRRQLGRNAGELKQKQEEQRNQSWIQERQRQKEEAKRAREEIKARVELDRLERQAQQREQKAAASELRQRSTAAAPVTSSVFSTISTGGSCRIQLRLPAGSTSVVELNRSGTLRDLREAAAQALSEAPSAVLLTSVYPRRELVAELDSQSLAELQLVPSGVVIVRLTRGVSSPQSGEGGVVSSLWGALMGLLQLIVGFLAYIKSSLVGLFGGSSEPVQGSRQQEGRQREEARVRKFRQEDFRDDDKDRSTYNGNSTQQQ